MTSEKNPSDDKMTILVVTDLHYIGQADNVCTIERRKCRMARTLLRKVFLRLTHMGVKPDLTLLLGDVVNDGLAQNAEEDLKAIREELDESNIPTLAVCGNHDGAPGPYAKIFNSPPGLHQHSGYGILLFNDNVAENDVTSRSPAALELPAQTVASHPDLPLIAVQHNPLYPTIECGYPYMPTNTDDILKNYEEAGVILSLSGHFHTGQIAAEHKGVTYHTTPALCESGFHFDLIHLRGREVRIEPLTLKMEVPGLADVHCHTEYAYCATTVAAAKNIKIAREMGLNQLILTEHAFHLYYESSVAWQAAWQKEADLVDKAFRERTGRMDAYKVFARKLRKENPDFVRLGLEVDVCTNGSLLLADEDREGWDLLIGAVHFIHDFVRGETSQAEAEQLFLRETAALLQNGIQVLAHPFRFFRRERLDMPTHLYERIAEMLAAANVAAEINYHINQPDPRFLRACIDRGVKIALGSDSHDLAEVGEFYPHLKILEAVGIHFDMDVGTLFRS